MKRGISVLLVLLTSLLLIGCPDPTGGSDDIAAPTSADDAKAIYAEASTALFSAIEDSSKGLKINSKAAMTMPARDINVTWTNDHVSMSGTIKASGTMNFPDSSFAANNTYSNVVDMSVDVELDGTMTDLEVTDPEDATKKYTITGTISHVMSMDNTMSLVTDANSVPTPFGSLSVTIDLETKYTVKRQDGIGAKFVLTFSDTQDMDLGTAPGASKDDPTCGYFATPATLKAYSTDGDLLYTTTIPLEDTPWVMSDFMGGAMGGGGGVGGGGGGEPPPGGGGGSSAVVIPDSTAANPTYATYESGFFTAINTVRTDGSVTAFANRDSSLDALARRYAEASKCDTDPTQLRARVATAIGTCSNAAFFIGGSTTTADYVNMLMNDATAGWVNQPGGTTTMRNAGFTKIGIGMVVGTNPGMLPGDTWHSVVILLATP